MKKSLKTLNEIKLTIPSRSSNESFARVAVTAFFAQLDPTLEEITDIKTAISEAVTNCIVHAYKESIGSIYIIAKILEDNTIHIKIKDTGCGIEDIKQAMEPLYTSSTSSERAGLGFSVMESFMDKIKVYSKIGKGTTIILTKKLSSRSIDD